MKTQTLILGLVTCASLAACSNKSSTPAVAPQFEYAGYWVSPSEYETLSKNSAEGKTCEQFKKAPEKELSGVEGIIKASIDFLFGKDEEERSVVPPFGKIDPDGTTYAPLAITAGDTEVKYKKIGQVQSSGELVVSDEEKSRVQTLVESVSSDLKINFFLKKNADNPEALNLAIEGSGTVFGFDAKEHLNHVEPEVMVRIPEDEAKQIFEEIRNCPTEVEAYYQELDAKKAQTKEEDKGFFQSLFSW